MKRATSIDDVRDHLGKPHHQQTVRLKYTHLSEHLAEYRAAAARAGRTYCPVCDYVAEHIDDDPIEVERHIYRHPDWGLTVLAETLRTTADYNDPTTEVGLVTTREIQRIAAEEMVTHNWQAMRYHIEDLFKHPQTRFYSDEARDMLLAHIRANHPNPKRFIMKPEVLAKIPTHYDFTGWPAPDYPELEHVVVTGTGVG